MKEHISYDFCNCYTDVSLWKPICFSKSMCTKGNVMAEHGNSRWIQGEVPCISSVENVVTGSKLCSGSLADLCCCINVWKSRADSAGPEINWK